VIFHLPSPEQKEKIGMTKVKGYQEEPKSGLSAGLTGVCSICKAIVETEGGEKILGSGSGWAGSPYNSYLWYEIYCPSCGRVVIVTTLTIN
jgi:hypothetical protein